MLVKLRPNCKFCIILSAIILIALIFLIPDATWADPVKPNSVDALITAFKNRFNDNTSNSVTTFLFQRAKVLFWILAFIQLAWNLYQLALHGRVEFQAVVLAITRQILILGIMYFFLNNAQSHFNAVLDGFTTAGKQVAGIVDGDAGSVAKVTGLGFDVVDKMWKSIEDIPSEKFGINKIPIYFVSGICSIIILISFAFASLTFIIAQCKMYLSAMVALFFMGFASNDYTRGMAITAYKSVFCCAIEVFTMFLLFGIASEFFPQIFADVNLQGSRLRNFLPVLAQVIVATFVFCGAIKTLPQFASGIIMGSPMGGGSSMGSGQALASAVASGVTTGAMMVGGAALGGVGGVAAAKAAGAGKLAALGKGLSGGLSGAIKGAYGGKTGQMSGIMREGAKNAILSGLNRNKQQSQNSASAPNQNPNNVSPN